MFEIKIVLERVGQHESRSAVARVTGHTRKTIGGYVKTAVALGWQPGAAVTEELAAAVYARHRPAHNRGTGESQVALLTHKEVISAWLQPPAGEKRGLTLTKVHSKLQRLGVSVPYSSLHRFAVAECGFRDGQRSTVRIAEYEAGRYAQVDFGRLGLIPFEGRRKAVWALIVVLPHSRHQFVFPTFSQKLPDLIGGLEDAWEFFAGVPSLLVVDNLRAAVTRSDRYDPVFNRTFDEYAAWRGFTIDAARAVDPQGKPHVERNVPYVRENFFRGEEWLNIQHVKRDVIRWCLTTAGLRVHGTTRKKPLLVFENDEQHLLKPLINKRFDPPSWGEYKVHPDHHVNVQKALYSVPTAFLGRQATVRSDSKLVQIYVGGEHVKTHIRQGAGGRSTDHADYPREKTAYTMRSPQWMIEQASAHGENVGLFAANLLAGDVPWAKLRQAQALMRLGAKYGWVRLDAACVRANEFGLTNTKRVEKILIDNLEASIEQPEQPTTAATPLQEALRFERPAGSFTHAQEES